MCKASYESLSAILNRFLPGVSSFESEAEIRIFCERFQGILEIFFAELSTNLESYSQLQYQFDAQTTQTATQKNNPLKIAKTGNETAKYLLDWHNDDTLTTINFLKEACNDLSGSQIAVFKTLTSSLPALLEKISPESIQKKCQNNKQKQAYFDKFFMQTFKNLWNEYEKKHKELMENKNRRFEIIKKEFQKNYSDIMTGDQ
jgi:predicted component of type VI protein secretion system